MELSFGEKIRNLREDNDLNQTQLGEAVGMTQRKISYIECGKYEPSLEDITALCRFFRVSADYLLGLPDYRKETTGCK
ncbi:MAG: helix-turn-helix transcriptional regulator [Oscillospiraceae bacterium]|nr:helix-turn-helix transcriptional regulator [Oscillospiraceae bacterium]MBQ7000267.1 helix-turn-helix transcriptional regulator [Oscillospiraceae bacterium]